MDTSEFEEYEDIIRDRLYFNYSTYGFNANSTQFDDSDELYEVPTGIIVLLSVCYGSISVLAVVGNSSVMWIVATSKRMQNVTHCFLANLALSDIVIGLFAIPFQFQAALLQRWNLPYFMCAFCPFVRVLCVNVSVFTLTAIAIDRHRAILNPLSAKPSKLKAKLVIAGIWIVSGSLAAPMAAAWRVIMVPAGTYGGRLHLKPFCQDVNLSKNAMLTYRALLGFLQYLTPLTIISCVYVRMGLKLWGNRAPGNAEDTRDAALMKNKKKVIKMLVIVVALFAICWLPLQMYNVLQYTYPKINEYRYINIIWFSFDWLAMSNSCCNPFIYGIYNEKFKREFQQRLPCKSRKPIKTPFTDSSNTNKTQSAPSSIRYDFRRPGSSKTSTTYTYEGSCKNSFRFLGNEPSKGPSLAKSEDFMQNDRNTDRYITEGTKLENLYVFPSEGHKNTKNHGIEEFCL